MKTLEQMIKWPVFAPAGDPPADPPAGDPPAGDPPADPPAGDPPAGDPPADPPAGHWADNLGLSAEDKNWFEARGMHKGEIKDALLNAIKGQRNAEKRLGGDPDQLISKPGEGQSVRDWMKDNAELFGLPADAEAYTIDRPEMPDGITYDEDLERAVVAAAFEQGIPPTALSPLVKAFADHQAQIATSIEAEIAETKQAMQAELQKDWGDQTKAKMAQARQGLSAVAEAAGLNSDGLAAFTQALKDITGTDATVFRFGAAIAEMMGEDSMEGLGKGANDLGMTAADARQRAAQLRSSDGAYGKAMAKGDRREMAKYRDELLRLDKIAATGA